MPRNARGWFRSLRSKVDRKETARRRRLQIEQMEKRRLLAVNISLNGSNELQIIDQIGPSSSDSLTISTDTGNSQHVISDPSNTLTVDLGDFPTATGNNTNEVRIPIGSFTGQVFVGLVGGNDSVTLDNHLQSRRCQPGDRCRDRD